MVREAMDALGGVDIFVNNAAITQHQPVTRITREAFYRTIDTNLAACVWACRDVAKPMIAQRSGSILITGSTVRVCPAYREASYRISKMGLKMYMETLAIELAPYNIRVNMITPGHFMTRLTEGLSAGHEQMLKAQIPLRRFGTPDELAAVAVLLTSPRLGSYITGADFVVDGGLSMRPLPSLAEDELQNLNMDERA
jgi:3-oxoacyl-[acyl-carrier protein] reductase